MSNQNNKIVIKELLSYHEQSNNSFNLFNYFYKRIKINILKMLCESLNTSIESSYLNLESIKNKKIYNNIKTELNKNIDYTNMIIKKNLPNINILINFIKNYKSVFINSINQLEAYKKNEDILLKEEMKLRNDQYRLHNFVKEKFINQINGIKNFAHLDLKTTNKKIEELIKAINNERISFYNDYNYQNELIKNNITIIESFKNEHDNLIDEKTKNKLDSYIDSLIIFKSNIVDGKYHYIDIINTEYKIKILLNKLNNNFRLYKNTSKSIKTLNSIIKARNIIHSKKNKLFDENFESNDKYNYVTSKAIKNKNRIILNNELSR